MKKLTFCVLSLLFSFTFAYAQGTLQFNRVVFLESGSAAQTVPAGKVWKIVAVTAYTSTSSTSSRPCILIVNGNTHHFAFRLQDASANVITNITNSLPFWLPAGITLQVPDNTTGSPLGNIKGVSILEFNLIP